MFYNDRMENSVDSDHLEKWILVEWGNGARGVVHSRYMLNRNRPSLKGGSSVTISRRGEQQLATFIARSNDRKVLEQIIGDETGPTVPPEPEVEDFSPSASSWQPSDDDDSDDSEGEERKKQLDILRNRLSGEKTPRRILTPSNKLNAKAPGSKRKSQHKNSRHSYSNRKRNNNENAKQINADNNKRADNNGLETKIVTAKMNVNYIEDLFKHVMGMFGDSIGDIIDPNPNDIIEHCEEMIVVDPVTHDVIMSGDDGNDNHIRSDDSNRSDDNILITNKYDIIDTNPSKNNKQSEWVPIGSGKTLIHKDKFKKVKWTSYTIATRTLLLALFPRRTLATHSLTGKRSPAFQNKPAKMCLDPKKISDIILEVMDRFHVKENLVRSIITTKCADESKMFRTRMQKKMAAKAKNGKTEQQEANKENNN